jgi:alpha-beta hydrolase superfamily lysophospholipase
MASSVTRPAADEPVARRATRAPGARSLAPDDTGRFPSADGTSLYAEWFAPHGPPRGAALVLHGYAEHCGRYHEVARVLSDAGLATLTFDFRGHGKSGGQRGFTRRIRDYLDDMDAGLRELDRRTRASLRVTPPKLPTLLVTHSNGGLVALRALADPTREPASVVGAVLSSPFLGLRAKVPPIKGLVGRLAGRYVPTLSLPSELDINHLTHDADKLAARRADTLCHEVATARWFTAALRAHTYIRDHIARVHVPTLWLVAGGDRIADPTVTRAVQARLRAPSSYHEFADMHHEVLNETGRADAFRLIREFVERTLPQPITE